MSAELVAGSIAHHLDDTAHQHVAIVLELRPRLAACLFFTSSPATWAKYYRRAHKDELALAGYVARRTTYLASVLRPPEDLTPTGLIFPEHRRVALLTEFFGGATQ